MKLGQIVSPNRAAMDRYGLPMKSLRYGEFMGYTRNNKFLRVRLFGNKSAYIYHSKFWKVTHKPVYCPEEEFHKNPRHKCVYSKELEESDLIQRHNSTFLSTPTGEGEEV